MASSFFHLWLFCCFIFMSSTTSLGQSPKPKSLILPVTKDSTTLQYFTKISQRTPLVPTTLLIDLGGPFVWVDCENGFTTSTYRPASCKSSQCSLANAIDCRNNTCELEPANPVSNIITRGNVGSDVLSIKSNGKTFSVPQFVFVCGITDLLYGFAKGVMGIAGLGRSSISLTSQLDSSFNFNKKLSVCLSSTSGNGAVILGHVDVAPTPLMYTPLFINPISGVDIDFEGDASSEYYIGVKSIKINGKALNFDSKVLSINTTSGIGGTKISTINPYTVLQSRIFKALAKTFREEINATRVASVAPFRACFNAKEIGMASTGPAAPTIDFVLQSEHVYWRMYGRNSIVQVSNEVWCLAFVDGGKYATTSVVIGGHQIEDNWLEFDLASSKMGFSNLVNRKTTCASYKFATADA